MPNSTKHKKARVADFAKAKLKLGKGKQVAANATNTSISARTIALPSQAIGAAKGYAPTSRRNLTLPELLIQCRHYSVPTKKEALIEIGQLLESHAGLLRQHLLPLVSTLSHLIADAAPSIRTQAIGMIRYVFDVLPIESLAGVTTGLILFTISGLSSLDEGVRIDALRVLDLLLERIPREIVRGWDGEVHGPQVAGLEEGGSGEREAGEKGVGAKVVEGLMGVLRVRSAGLAPSQGGFTSAATGELSPAARVAILTTLATFLRAALSPELSATALDAAPWYLARSFRSQRDYNSFLDNFGRQPSRVVDCRDELEMQPVSVESFDFALAGQSSDLAPDTLFLPSVAVTRQPVASTSTAQPASLLTLLHPTLLSGFLDTAPAAFAPGSVSFPGMERATVEAVLTVARELYARELGGTPGADGVSAQERAATRKLLVGFLTHVGPYFPFGADELGTRTADAAAQLDRLNRAFCSLVSLLVLSAPGAVAQAEGKMSDARQKKKQVQLSKVDTLVHNVRDWALAALRGELNDSALNADSYAGLEPTLWALLNMASEPGNEPSPADEVLEALLAHFATSNTRGELKPRAFSFIARAVLVQADGSPAYLDSFSLSTASAESREAVQAWVRSLPKFLWELNGEQAATRLVLLFLLRLAQMGNAAGGFLDPQTLSALRASLAPFFSLVHPARGVLFGPFGKVTEQTKNLAMDVVVSLERAAKRAAGEGAEREKEARKGGKPLRDAVKRAVGKEGGLVAQRWKAVQQ